MAAATPPILCEIHINSYMNDNNAHFRYVNYIFYQSTSKDRNADEINSADYQKIKNGCQNGCRHFGKVRKKNKKNHLLWFLQTYEKSILFASQTTLIWYLVK